MGIWHYLRAPGEEVFRERYTGSLGTGRKPRVRGLNRAWRAGETPIDWSGTSPARTLPWEGHAAAPVAPVGTH